MSQQRKPSMASEARLEVARHLADFWRERVKAGQVPWKNSTFVEYARATVWIRTQMWEGTGYGGAAELTKEETNMLLHKILLDLGGFLESARTAREILELELRTGLLVLGSASTRVQAQVDTGAPIVSVSRLPPGGGWGQPHDGQQTPGLSNSPVRRGVRGERTAEDAARELEEQLDREGAGR